MSAGARRAAARVRDAAGMTLVVHAVRAACALLLLWPWLDQLGPELSRTVYTARLGALELAALLEVGARSGHRLLPWTLGCVGGYVLLSPLLGLAWLCALARSEPIRASFARAVSGYVGALALGAGALVGWLALLGAIALAHQPALAALLPQSAALEHAWTVACLAAVASCGLLLTTVHDLARARLALGARAWPALRFGIARIDRRLLARHALFACASAGTAAAAELAGRLPLAGAAALLFALQQLLALAATALRGTWLAMALTASQVTSGTGALPDGDLDAERLA